MPLNPGDKFGHLTIIERLPDHISKSGKKLLTYLCECDCENHTRLAVRGWHLVSGHTTSCGCESRRKASERLTAQSTTHGLSHNKIYRMYMHMVDRCYNTNCKEYHNYGEKGITICKEWYNPEKPYDTESIKSFYNWCMMNGYTEGLSIDLIYPSKGYSPDNCRFVPEYCLSLRRNTTRYLDISDGEKISAIKAANLLGLDYIFLYNKAKYCDFDMSKVMEEAISPYGPYKVIYNNRYHCFVPYHPFFYYNDKMVPVSQDEYISPGPKPALWQCDDKGFITGPLL